MPTATGVLTQYGLSALAAAVQGNYIPPRYLVLENNGSTLATPASAGATSLLTAARVDLPGDTQLVLGAGTASQEVVAFTNVTGVTYTLATPLTFSHPSGDPLCRLPLASDTLLQVVNELEFDHTNFPGARLQSVSGYATAAGEWTMQFFLSGIQASAFLMTIGLSDSPLLGQGNLHAHAVVGVNHVFNAGTGGVDIELDLPLNLAVSL
jgi:hypothetical protein